MPELSELAVDQRLSPQGNAAYRVSVIDSDVDLRQAFLPFD
jgi:hypothetical protein